MPSADATTPSRSFDLDIVAMAGDVSLNSRPKLAFGSAKPRFGLVPSIALIFIAAVVFSGANAQIFAPYVNSAILRLIACALLVQAIRLLLRASSRWIIEIDAVQRRLTIYRQRLGFRRTIDLNCRFDECSRLGTVEYKYAPDGPSLYGVYVEVKRGGRNDIPMQYLTFDEAAKVASELSAASAIPRFDRQAW